MKSDPEFYATRTTNQHSLQARKRYEVMGKDAFSLWFCSAPDVETQKQNARENFPTFFYKTQFQQHIMNVQKKRSLEIGFGGGRLLYAASPHFDKVIGIDIHNAFDITAEILDERGIENYELIHYDDRNKIKPGSIHFVYSYLVFSHFPSWEIAENYLEYLATVMNSRQSCGIIYLGYGGLIDPIGTFTPTHAGEGWWQASRINPRFACEQFSKYFDVIDCDMQLDNIVNQAVQREFYIAFANKGSGLKLWWPNPISAAYPIRSHIPQHVRQQLDL